jgi:hypothetical protein
MRIRCLGNLYPYTYANVDWLQTLYAMCSKFHVCVRLQTCMCTVARYKLNHKSCMCNVANMRAMCSKFHVSYCIRVRLL